MKNLAEESSSWLERYYWIFVLTGIVVLSFSLFMFSLLQYPISYGPDGPYYDIQVRYILRTGFPSSNDPPLLYYYLTPFVMITGDSYMGIKIGMSIISAAIAIPAFFLSALMINFMRSVVRSSAGLSFICTSS